MAPLGRQASDQFWCGEVVYIWPQARGLSKGHEDADLEFLPWYAQLVQACQAMARGPFVTAWLIAFLKEIGWVPARSGSAAATMSSKFPAHA